MSQSLSVRGYILLHRQKSFAQLRFSYHNSDFSSGLTECFINTMQLLPLFVI